MISNGGSGTRDFKEESGVLDESSVLQMPSLCTGVYCALCGSLYRKWTKHLSGTGTNAGKFPWLGRDPVF